MFKQLPEREKQKYYQRVLKDPEIVKKVIYNIQKNSQFAS